ncbi:MAG TPA: AAA family ATPase [Solirubrobacteraceae bacterium]|nr:AAA family ATPase [Solirubrobacteraceae bacterium]
MAHELPASLRIASPFPFVGRTVELGKLRALLPRAAGEGRRVVLLGGEPGSGKSRLAREFAAEAAAEGALVLYGACDAVVHTPYGPFAQALRHLTRVLGADELREALGASGGELTRLLPDLPAQIGELPAPVKADADTERHRLHMIVTDLLSGISRGQPVVLVIEDGHWADASTLLLLRHLARAPWSGRVMIFATFRDTEADVPESLSTTLADLRRADDVLRLSIGGLSDQEVSEFVQRTSEGRLGPALEDLAQAISELTGGNPFLVCELWRSLIETGAIELVEGEVRLARPLSELGTPESVREVVSERLTRLAPATTGLLELAATAGSQFEIDLIRRASGLDEAALVSALDEALRSGIVEELARLHRAYRFTHELVRRAVYDRMSGVRRAELHLRVGEALEAIENAAVLPDLAHHFSAAVPLGAVDRAIEYNVRAAEVATAGLAFEEAAAMLRTALELGIEDSRTRAEVLLELGSVAHRAGRSLDALNAFRSASEIARELNDAELVARAAIGFEDASWRPGVPEPYSVPLLEEASAALGDAPSDLRVRLLSGLARALDMQGNQERAQVVRTSAISLARRMDDRAGLAGVLTRSYWSRGSSSLEEILEMLGEATAIGEELGDMEIRAEAISWTVPALVAVGDLAAARSVTSQLRDMAQITAQPFYQHVAEHYGSAIALGDGLLAEAEAMARRSEEAGRLLAGRDASGTYGIQMFSLRREQGRIAELAPVIRVLAGGGRDRGSWRPGFASVLAELGMDAEARRELDLIVADGLESFRESLWLAALTYLTDAGAAIGHERIAELVYPELAPLTGSNVMIGHLVAWYGSADRYLGMLAATLGEWDQAEEHFERALDLDEASGAGTWLAHTIYEYARMLFGRGGNGERASELLARAEHLAASIGLGALSGRIAALRREHPSSAPERRAAAELPDDLSAREVQVLRLVARGLSNREIGAALYISEHTAANHIRSILRKTGCANRTEAASYAHAHALADA